jgi:UDP-N-acetyl-D-glucosamine dehydrogenase
MSVISTSAMEVLHGSVCEELENKIHTRRASLGVIGLGYVGLPLALTMCEAGFTVTGLDVDKSRVKSLAEGRSYITDISDSEVAAVEARHQFKASTDMAVISELDAISICVPTPLRKSKDPDMSCILSATEAIAQHLRRGQLIILESTTYPGTTEELILTRLQETGLRVGEDFYLAFSPERVDPGNVAFPTKKIPKVVGGVTPTCGRLAQLLYSQCIEQVHLVSTTRVAEMVKLLENSFRSVNIALVNEFALFCAQANIDIWEVIRAASTKPFGYTPFYPGPGLGGHCIPVDPMYLLWKARTDGFDLRFIDLADKINGNMPKMVTLRAMELLNQRGKLFKGAHIHLAGIAYKRDIGDVRESPALEIMKLCRSAGAVISYSDPFVPKVTVQDTVYESQNLSPELLEACDMVMIVTNHSQFDYHEIVRHAPFVFDTRNATDGMNASNIVRL